MAQRVAKNRTDLGLRWVRPGNAVLALALAGWLADAAPAQAAPARVLITAPVDDSRPLRLTGNTRPEANARDDRGPLPDSRVLEHLQLLLKRPAERQAALRATIAQLHDPGSPKYHHWLTVAQLAEQYGLAAQDLAAVIAWLGQQGFVVNTVYPSTLLIDFSGTAAQIRAAFRTEIHAFDVHGVRHYANVGDPYIPAALAPAVTGIVALHDFRPHTNYKATPAYTNGSYSLVAPGDLATIYNLNPLFSAGMTGKGQTVVVIEDTQVYSTADWATFRSTFNLTANYPSGAFTQVYPAPPSGSNNCSTPGVVSGDEGEAELDAEWASAAAPNATIELAACHSSGTFGGLIALENLVNGANPPAIVSISYGECEAANGATANAAFNSIYEQAVAEHTSIFVSAGDEGAAGCDANTATATHGIAVSGFASTPYNVAVGGTDFGDTYAGTTGLYWSSSNDPTTSATPYASALSYVPEIPWNNSCASTLISAAEGFGTPYGSGGFCNSATGEASFLATTAGSGGPSGCATGAPSSTDVVSGTCTGYAKPSWQAGLIGNPGDGVRDLPDVALFAANGVWGHYYVYCDSDTADNGKACTGAPSGWSGAGGTSFAAPILAGIQALVNQSVGGPQGNPNPVYYALAKAAYGTGGNSTCNSSSGNGVSGSCVFHDVTLGDIDVNCTGTNDCYLPSGVNGVLSTGNGAYAKAYGTGTGWDFATGIGTINAANLVASWTADLALSGGGHYTANGLVTYTWTVTNNGPQTAQGIAVTTVLPTGVSLVASASPGCTQSGQTISCAVGTLADHATATLTVVLQPGALQNVDLSFNVSSNNANLDPGNATAASSVSVPLPPWAAALLAALLSAFALRSKSPYGAAATPRMGESNDASAPGGERRLPSNR